MRQVIESAVAQLGELGASSREISIPIVENAGAVSKCITDMDGAMVHYERLKTRITEYDHNTRVRLLTAILTPAQALNKAQKVRTLIREAVLEALDEVDVIVLPTSPTGAPLLPTEAGIKSQEDARSRISRESAISPGRSTWRTCRRCPSPAGSRRTICRCRCNWWVSPWPTGC